MTHGRNSPAGAAWSAVSPSPLSENHGLAFPGENHSPVLEITARQAQIWLAEPNPSGRPNQDVLRPIAGSRDLLGASQHRWTVDFPSHMDEREAALYIRPFSWVRRRLKPTAGRADWWRPGRLEPAMRIAVVKRARYLATPAVSRRRIFAWLPPEVIPDRSLTVFARDDDWFFGVLQSRVHAVWVSRTARPLRAGGMRYLPGPCCDTFPFPWSPGAALSQLTRTQEERRSALAQAARTLEQQRRAWLEDGSDPRRSLASLYATQPAWLQSLHADLDDAAVAAYGWRPGIADAEVLVRLTDLNRARAFRRHEPRPIPF